MSISKASLKYTGLFEAELLLELMLRYWPLKHLVRLHWPSARRA